MKLKNAILIFFLISYSCAPVLSKNLHQQGISGMSLMEIKENLPLNKGRLFILGGVIVKTTINSEGSLIEAIYVPVDSRGYLESLNTADGRFLAIYSSKDLLDPVIFREQREVTLAGELIGTRSGKIDEMDYVYPLFEITEIYLWREEKEYGRYYYPPYPYYPPYYPYRYYNPYYPWRY
jgi:outer membrane lipoprotein